MQLTELHLYIYIARYLGVCVCFRPPDRGVCPNYEVVELQPWTGTPPEPRLCL